MQAPAAAGGVPGFDDKVFGNGEGGAAGRGRMHGQEFYWPGDGETSLLALKIGMQVGVFLPGVEAGACWD